MMLERHMSRLLVALAFLGGCPKSEDFDGDGAIDGDCAPYDALTLPGAPELCDARDNDCDGEVDEGAGGQWFTDADGDGFGVDATATVACFGPPGMVTLGGDCADANSERHPGAKESCDVAEDLDCDGVMGNADDDGDGSRACVDCDDGDAAVFPGVFYRDLDGDGFGDPGDSIEQCGMPSGYLLGAGDCDDTDPTIHVGAEETCDGVDQDCDRNADDGLALITYYVDQDSDGFGDSKVSVQTCAGAPTGYTTRRGDCDDADKGVGPLEACDGMPNGCDGGFEPREGWTSAEEYGHVGFSGDGPGVSGDLTEAFAGVDGAPAHWTAPSNGRIVACPGLYYVSISNGGFDLDIGNPEALGGVVTLSGGHTDPVVTVTGGTVRVIGTGDTLTIQDGYSDLPGGNVSCTDATYLELTNVAVRGGESAAEGGGVYLAHCPALFTGVTLADNTARQGGGLWFSSSLGWRTVWVEGNSATNGGGGVYGTRAQLTSLEGATFVDNDAIGSDGGGLYLASGGVAALKSVTMDGNHARRGGGTFLADGDLTMTCFPCGLSGFSNNTSDETGSQVEVTQGGSVSLKNTVFRDATALAGGPIAVRDASTFMVVDSEVRDNQGVATGGIWVETGSVEFYNTDFVGNGPNDAFANSLGYTIGLNKTGTCTDTSGCSF